jgi:hypothetical protein
LNNSASVAESRPGQMQNYPFLLHPPSTFVVSHVLVAPHTFRFSDCSLCLIVFVGGFVYVAMEIELPADQEGA